MKSQSILLLAKYLARKLMTMPHWIRSACLAAESGMFNKFADKVFLLAVTVYR